MASITELGMETAKRYGMALSHSDFRTLWIANIFAGAAAWALISFMVENRVQDPDGLKEFAQEGYTYRPELSNQERLLFVSERDWAA